MRNVVRFDALSPSLLVACLCAGLALAPEWIAQNLEWNRDALGSGEVWRLWTGHLVHYSPLHAVIDAATLALLGWGAEAHFGKRHVATAFLLGAPLMSCALFMFPSIAEYRGASGLATLIGTVLGCALWWRNPTHRLALAALLCIFLLKTAGDALGLSLTLAHLPPEVSVAWQIHLLGIVLAGAAFVCAMLNPAERTRAGLTGSRDSPSSVRLHPRVRTNFYR